MPSLSCKSQSSQRTCWKSHEVIEKMRRTFGCVLLCQHLVIQQTRPYMYVNLETYHPDAIHVWHLDDMFPGSHTCMA